MSHGATSDLRYFLAMICEVRDRFPKQRGEFKSVLLMYGIPFGTLGIAKNRLKMTLLDTSRRPSVMVSLRMDEWPADGEICGGFEEKRGVEVRDWRLETGGKHRWVAPSRSQGRRKAVVGGRNGEACEVGPAGRCPAAGGKGAGELRIFCGLNCYCLILDLRESAK
ncbi:hypothetical protein Pr1d_05960 [Bythopirellula goksoeyrii]|uniref:Uncharacterized protein n=1 Tax=Bythopirellula goksoeyrii TaxID=1400387 RepID=A0A5B9Q728_9BACT|nr:hypothetical protein Pr1d_05960 [Bythopirellula goksoeyrii]